MPLSDLLKGSKDSKKLGLFHLTLEAKVVFCRLRKVFTKALVLLHFDLQKLIYLVIDMLGFAISGILY